MRVRRLSLTRCRRPRRSRVPRPRSERRSFSFELHGLRVSLDGGERWSIPATCPPNPARPLRKGIRLAAARDDAASSAAGRTELRRRRRNPRRRRRRALADVEGAPILEVRTPGGSFRWDVPRGTRASDAARGRPVSRRLPRRRTTDAGSPGPVRGGWQPRLGGGRPPPRSEAPPRPRSRRRSPPRGRLSPWDGVGRAVPLRALKGCHPESVATRISLFSRKRSFASLRMTVYLGTSSNLIRDPTVTFSFAACPPAISSTVTAGTSGP